MPGPQQRLAPKHLLLQLEVRNAVDHQPTDPVVAIIDMNLIAMLAKFFGGSQTAGAGADDSDGLFALCHWGDGLHPAVLERRFGDVLLDRADGNALEALLDDAVALA